MYSAGQTRWNALCGCKPLIGLLHRSPVFHSLLHYTLAGPRKAEPENQYIISYI